MDIIPPIAVTDAILYGTNVPHNDYAEWDVVITYADGDKVIVAADHKIYESLQAANVGHTPSTSPTWWLDYSATNRWMVFDGKAVSQTTQATSMMYVLQPGVAVDSLACFTLDADSVQIVQSYLSATNLILNGEDWTGASGTTPPNNWERIGTCLFSIVANALEIDIGGADQGIAQTITVVPGTTMHLLFLYKAPAGSTCKFSVYDVTHSSFIVAEFTLPVNITPLTGWASVFTIPAGCVSIKISLLSAAGAGSITYDSVYVLSASYNTTIDATSKTDITKTDMPLHSDGVIQIIISGTTAKCGEIIVGTKQYLGELEYSPSIGIIDYSIKEVDAFGNYTITERAYSKRMSCNLLLTNATVDTVMSALSLYRATPLVWVGSEDYSALIVYGFFKDFNIEIPYPDYSACSLEIEGLI